MSSTTLVSGPVAGQSRSVVANPRVVLPWHAASKHRVQTLSRGLECRRKSMGASA